MRNAIIENGVVVNIIEGSVPDLELVPDDGKVRIGWLWNGQAFVAPPPDIPKMTAAMRIRRDQLLADSDWTQVADAPVDQAAWATYRQALRDIPTQAGFPLNVEWPVQP